MRLRSGRRTQGRGEETQGRRGVIIHDSDAPPFASPPPCSSRESRELALRCPREWRQCIRRENPYLRREKRAANEERGEQKERTAATRQGRRAVFLERAERFFRQRPRVRERKSYCATPPFFFPRPFFFFETPLFKRNHALAGPQVCARSAADQGRRRAPRGQAGERMNKAEATLSRERDDRSDDCCSKAAERKTEKKRWLFSSPIE